MTLPTSILVKSQSQVKEYTLPGGEVMTVKIRYDDEHGHGRNSFAITGNIMDGKKEAGSGCIHDEIVWYAPELKHLIKWHLCSSDGPIHYIANSLYHARTTTHEGKKVGEPVKFEKYLRFDGSPFLHKEPENGFFDYLDAMTAKDVDWRNVEVRGVAHEKEDIYGSKYTFKGFDKEWHYCPFDTPVEAHSWMSSLKVAQRTSEQAYVFESMPIEWAKAVEPNLGHARSCAYWPEASLEDFTEENLKQRLPGLMQEFKKDMEAIGFVY